MFDFLTKKDHPSSGMTGGRRVPSARSATASVRSTFRITTTNPMPTAPYAGRMRRDAIAAALREAGYRGHITFEACSFVSALPADRTVCVAAIGRSLAEKVAPPAAHIL